MRPRFVLSALMCASLSAVAAMAAAASTNDVKALPECWFLHGAGEHDEAEPTSNPNAFLDNASYWGDFGSAARRVGAGSLRQPAAPRNEGVTLQRSRGHSVSPARFADGASPIRPGGAVPMAICGSLHFNREDTVHQAFDDPRLRQRVCTQLCGRPGCVIVDKIIFTHSAANLYLTGEQHLSSQHAVHFQLLTPQSPCRLNGWSLVVASLCVQRRSITGTVRFLGGRFPLTGSL